MTLAQVAKVLVNYRHGVHPSHGICEEPMPEQPEPTEEQEVLFDKTTAK